MPALSKRWNRIESKRPRKRYRKRKIFCPIQSINNKQMCHLKNSRPKIVVLVTKVLLFENLKHFILHLEGTVLVEKKKQNKSSIFFYGPNRSRIY